MAKADRVHSTPPLNSSPTLEANPPQGARADSADSFSLQPAIGQPESQTLTSESASPTEGIDLAQLRFALCLVWYGATLDDAAVVSGELERLRKAAERKRRRRFELVGVQLVAAQA